VAEIAKKFAMSIEFTGISEQVKNEDSVQSTENLTENTGTLSTENQPPAIDPTTNPSKPTDPPEIDKIGTKKEYKKGLSKPANKEPIESPKKRHTYSVNLTLQEGDYINQIIEARIAAGITESAAHFFVQCVDFAVNHVPGTKFAKPEIPAVAFKNGFYKQK
jgi:hypothetical protein